MDVTSPAIIMSYLARNIVNLNENFVASLALCYNVILGLLSTSPTVLQSVPVQQKYYNLSWAKHHSVTQAASIFYLVFTLRLSGKQREFLQIYQLGLNKSGEIFYLNRRNIT